jgi:hypothetical protein
VIQQLASYGVLWWLGFAAAAFALAHIGGLWGTAAAWLLVAVVVAALDVQWIRAEMRRPGWDGQPDQDIVFMAGVFIRVALINTFLLPVSALGWVSGGTRAARTAVPSPESADGGRG